MKNIITAVLCTLSVFCFAQTSSIYMKDKTKLVGTVTSVTKDKIIVIPASSSTTVEYPLSKVDSVKTQSGTNAGDSTRIAIQLNAADSLEINRVFRVNFFSDFVGLSSEKPNGLLQTEISGNFDLFRDRPKLPKGELGIPHYMYFLKNIQLSLTISKMDNKLRTIPLNYVPADSMKHIHIFDLVQYSNLGMSGKLNILTFETRSRDTVTKNPFIRCRFFADGVIQGYRTTVVDTLIASNPQYDMFCFGLGFQAKFRVEHYVQSNYKGPRIGAEFVCGYMWMTPVGNQDEIAIRYGPIYTVELKKNNEYNTANTSKNNLIFQPRITVFYERSDRQRIYFTAALHNNYYKTNRFFQMQLGYSQAIGMKQLGQLFKP